MRYREQFVKTTEMEFTTMLIPEYLQGAVARYNALLEYLERPRDAEEQERDAEDCEAARIEGTRLAFEFRQRGLDLKLTKGKKWVTEPYTLDDLVASGVLLAYNIAPIPFGDTRPIVWWFITYQNIQATGLAETTRAALRDLRGKLARYW